MFDSQTWKVQPYRIVSDKFKICVLFAQKIRSKSEKKVAKQHQRSCATQKIGIDKLR